MGTLLIAIAYYVTFIYNRRSLLRGRVGCEVGCQFPGDLLLSHSAYVRVTRYLIVILLIQPMNKLLFPLRFPAKHTVASSHYKRTYSGSDP